MWLSKAAIFLTVTLHFAQIQAGTYFFNVNKTSNEYIIQAQARSKKLNNEQPKYSNIVGELRNNVTTKISQIRKERIKLDLLDTEWNYKWQNVTRQKLPIFMVKYYKTFPRDIHSSAIFYFNTRPQNSRIFTFSLNENIYKLTTQIEFHAYFPIEKNSTKDSLILRLYQMEDNFFNESALINPDSHKLLNIIYLSQANSGWQIFKITSALNNWFQNNTNLSLFITMSKPNEEKFTIYKNIQKDRLRSFVLLKNIITDSEFTESNAINGTKAQESSCQKTENFVDFEKFNWTQFIIEPVVYNAFTCSGSCQKTTKHLTNHWKITSVLANNKKNLCCRATDYTSLPIMFYDRNNNVVIKNYNEMIITKCGCR